MPRDASFLDIFTSDPCSFLSLDLLSKFGLIILDNKTTYYLCKSKTCSKTSIQETGLKTLIQETGLKTFRRQPQLTVLLFKNTPSCYRNITYKFYRYHNVLPISFISTIISLIIS